MTDEIDILLKELERADVNLAMLDDLGDEIEKLRARVAELEEECNSQKFHIRSLQKALERHRNWPYEQAV